MTPPTIASPNVRVSRLTQARMLAWIAVACLSASAIGFMPQNKSLLLPTVLMLMGGVSLGVTLGLRRDWGFPRLERIATVEADRRVRWLPVLLGVALLTLLGLRGGKLVLPMQVYQLTNIHIQILMLFGGLALVVVGIGGVQRQDAAAFAAWTKTHRREIGLMLALVVIAFAVRMINLQDAVRAFMDEGPFVEAVVKMREDPLVPLTAPLHPVASSTRLFPYVQMVLSDLFGSHLANFRMGAVLFGALTVAATYALARGLFDKRTALLAGVLLAVFPPHIHMSRIGIYNIADPLFGVLALVFFTRAVQTQRRLFYALAGAMLGLLPYVYEGGELLFPPLVLLWAGWLALSKGPRPTRRGIGWMLLVALLLALPVYYTNLSYHLPLFTRLDDASAGGDYLLALLVAPNGMERVHTFLAQRLLPPMLHYVHAPDASLFYSGETALILPWLVPLFLLGLFQALRRASSGLLVLWVVLTTLGNSVILYNNWTARFVVVMPAIAILCAAGLRYTLPMLSPTLARRAWLYKGFLIVAAVAQLTYYFGPHLAVYDLQILEVRRHYDVVFRTLELPEDTVVYFDFEDYVQVPFTYSFLRYLGAPYEFHSVRLLDTDLAALPRDRRYAFFVESGDKPTLDRLRELWYLDGPYYSKQGPPQQYALYIVTPWLWREPVQS